MRRIVEVILACTLGFLGSWSAGLILEAQTVQSKPPAPSVYVPSEVQLLRLQVKQRDALLAQQELLRAQAQYQNALAALNAEADKVKLDNKWPATLTFDPGTVTFNEPPAPAMPAAPKPEDKKP
jgi:hypothetical protein